MGNAKHYIYADNAATTPLRPEALRVMLPLMGPEYANPSSLHAPGRAAKNALESARATIAGCIGAKPEEIFFTSGGTESNNWIVQIMSHYGRIVTSAIEHHSILTTLYQIRERFNWPAPRYAKPDSKGTIDPVMLEKVMPKRASIVSVMLANNEIGTIEPVAELAGIAHKYNARFHTDAVQAVGHIPIDVDSLGIDMLSASAHKFGGPRGTGFLYVRGGDMYYGMVYGGKQESGRRAGTENLPSIVGMAEALRVSCERMDETAERLNRLTGRFWEIVKNKSNFTALVGEPVNRLPGHISIAIPGLSAEALMHILDMKGVAVSTGAACNSKSTEVSHVLRAIHLPTSMANGTIRISFGWQNTLSDAETVAHTLVSSAEKLLLSH